MYGKIFESMYKGTLYGQWEAIVTFQQLIVLCDKDGLVDMTPPAIAATTSIPLDIIQKGIEALQQPDPYSRSPAQDGRRIVLADPARPWGWTIVNYDYYKNLASREDKKEKDRLRMAENRNQINHVAGSREQSQTVADVAHVDVDVDVDVDTNITTSSQAKACGNSASGIQDCPHQEIIALYHKILPTNPTVKMWGSGRQASLRQRWKENPSIEEWTAFFSRVAKSKFLTGRVNQGDRKPFVASLAWLTKAENFAKVLEGRYE
jgi:hypothetical protein